METIIRQYSLTVSGDGEEISIEKLPEYRPHCDGGGWWECRDLSHRLRVHRVSVIQHADGSVVEQIEVHEREQNWGSGWQRVASEGSVHVYRRPQPTGERRVYSSPSDWLKPFQFPTRRGLR